MGLKMMSRSELCGQCFGGGKVPSLADRNGSVWGDGGERDCDRCKGSGREIYEVAKPTAKKIRDYEKKLDETMKRIGL